MGAFEPDIIQSKEQITERKGDASCCGMAFLFLFLLLTGVSGVEKETKKKEL
ncbi:hypothetical protein BRYFOR_05138 [Marvinbryantia formatexigens DSM 14469]|uniref:Uncharacterized protein n=1 Tax=Marvinbryantia formatexigens DSM 14469 TaxID=478749 RepID=C6L948_9FIRM|nr:hypothetical protein BRYFOR_05138 [Marvinbryantia formatexigens DSM 14469]